MNFINAADQVTPELLVRACKDALVRCSHAGVRVAAAVSTLNGTIYTGLQVRSTTCGHCSTCAEPSAISAALAETSGSFDLCVAVRRCGSNAFEVISPCGTCREVLRDHGFRRVAVGMDGEVVITATPDELLPWS